MRYLTSVNLTLSRAIRRKMVLTVRRSRKDRNCRVWKKRPPPRRGSWSRRGLRAAPYARAQKLLSSHLVGIPGPRARGTLRASCPGSWGMRRVRVICMGFPMYTVQNHRGPLPNIQVASSAAPAGDRGEQPVSRNFTRQRGEKGRGGLPPRLSARALPKPHSQARKKNGKKTGENSKTGENTGAICVCALVRKQILAAGGCEHNPTSLNARRRLQAACVGRGTFAPGAGRACGRNS
jgi:hypothetical protein